MRARQRLLLGHLPRGLSGRAAALHHPAGGRMRDPREPLWRGGYLLRGSRLRRRDVPAGRLIARRSLADAQARRVHASRGGSAGTVLWTAACGSAPTIAAASSSGAKT